VRGTASGVAHPERTRGRFVHAKGHSAYTAAMRR